MKRIITIVFSIIALMGGAAIFNSCQEDAPVINYTMNVTVVNDFTKVVEAIDNGFLKNEEAIKKLTDAIDGMNSEQAAKLQAITDVLNSVNTTLDTKLALIEAAMRAQTLSLEAKLDLLEAAVKAQTIKMEEVASQLATAIDGLGSTMAEKLDAITAIIESTSATLAEKLTAIEAAMQAQTLSLEAKLDLLEAAVKTLPDYSAKFDAIEACLDAIAAELERIGDGQPIIAAQIATITTAINELIAAVDNGSTGAAEALAQIIQKLEELKEAITNGLGQITSRNVVILDGVEMDVLRAGIDKSDLEEENNYDIYLFLSEDKSKYVEIMANGDLHNGKTLDLSSKENKHEGWFWAVSCSDSHVLFKTFGKPDNDYPVFQSGTLRVEHIGPGTEFQITLKNGKVKAVGMHGDGLEHTISVDFKGELEFSEY
jgi:archaellum component FlaC